MRVAIYRRVSSEEQALHGFSLEAQREACINKAKEIGATSILEFADEGETGKTLDRPGLESLRHSRWPYRLCGNFRPGPVQQKT